VCSRTWLLSDSQGYVKRQAGNEANTSKGDKRGERSLVQHFIYFRRTASNAIPMMTRMARNMTMAMRVSKLNVSHLVDPAPDFPMQSDDRGT